jgi:hypothetical protein
MNGSASQFLINNNSAVTPAISAPNALLVNFPLATITATTFEGGLSGNSTTTSQANGVFTTADTTTASNSPIFFGNNSSGNQSTKVNSNLNWVPSTNTLNATNIAGTLTGTASNALAVNTTSDNTSGTYYIPFTKTSAGTGKTLYVDDTTGPLSYNPSTSTLGCSAINGSSGINLQYNGTTQSTITTNGVQETLLTTQGTATYATSTLTFVTTASAPYPTYYNNIITISGSTSAQTISTITPPTNMPVGGCYTCYITNSNTSAGAITINATSLGTGIKTTYTSAVVIPISGFGFATLTKVGSSTYIFSVNIVA